MKERDYSNTGESTQGGTPKLFFTPNMKEAEFQVRKGGEVQRSQKGIAGYLDKTSLEWSDPSENGNTEIPPYFEMKLHISARDIEDENETVKEHILGFNIGQNAAGSILNRLLTAVNDDQWLDLRFFDVVLYKKDTDKYGRPYTKYSVDGLEFDPNFPWNDEKKGFDGVPKAIDTGVADPRNEDRNIFDFKPVRNFWIYQYIRYIHPAINKGEVLQPKDFKDNKGNVVPKAFEIVNDAIKTYGGESSGNDFASEVEKEKKTEKQPFKNYKEAEEAIKTTLDLATPKQIATMWEARIQPKIEHLTLEERKNIYALVNPVIRPTGRAIVNGQCVDSALEDFNPPESDEDHPFDEDDDLPF